MDKFKNICIFLVVVIIITLIVVLPAIYCTCKITKAYHSENSEYDQSAKQNGISFNAVNIFEKSPESSGELVKLIKEYDNLFKFKFSTITNLYLVFAVMVSIAVFGIGIILKKGKKVSANVCYGIMTASVLAITINISLSSFIIQRYLFRSFIN